MRTKLEETLIELGYEYIKPRPKWNDMVKKYVLKFEHTVIMVEIGSPNYPEFDDMYCGLPEILRTKQVLKEINKAFKTMAAHQEILEKLGIKFWRN